jgi:hypothetical protein
VVLLEIHRLYGGLGVSEVLQGEVVVELLQVYSGAVQLYLQQ